MIVVLWGVSGCGKSTVGAQLAVELGWTFYDADDFHPAANVEKMRQDIALDDADRYPWLAQLRTLLHSTNAQGRNAVLACSALKQDYRVRLGIDQVNIHGVHLSGTEALIRARLTTRDHEFMRDSLLASQFATLELSSTGLRFDIGSSPQVLCADIIQALALAQAPAP